MWRSHPNAAVGCGRASGGAPAAEEPERVCRELAPAGARVKPLAPVSVENIPVENGRRSGRRVSDCGGEALGEEGRAAL